MIKSLIFILVAAFAISAQTYAGVSFSGSAGMGNSRPSVGAVVGRSTKIVDGEASVFSLCKRDPNAGHCGVGVSGRLTAKKSIFQAGGVVSAYKVQGYSKSSFEGLVGLQRKGLELNYRHDFTSVNKNRRIEARGTRFFPNHLFLRGEAYYNRYRDFYGKGKNGFSETLNVGYWF